MDHDELLRALDPRARAAAGKEAAWWSDELARRHHLPKPEVWKALIGTHERVEFNFELPPEGKLEPPSASASATAILFKSAWCRRRFVGR